MFVRVVAVTSPENPKYYSFYKVLLHCVAALWRWDVNSKICIWNVEVGGLRWGTERGMWLLYRQEECNRLLVQWNLVTRKYGENELLHCGWLINVHEEIKWVFNFSMTAVTDCGLCCHRLIYRLDFPVLRNMSTASLSIGTGFFFRGVKVGGAWSRLLNSV